jgi:hypothetical protein
VRRRYAPILCFSRSYCSTCRLSASHTRTAFLRVRWKDSSSTLKSSLASSIVVGFGTSFRGVQRIRDRGIGVKPFHDLFEDLFVVCDPRMDDRICE